MATTLLVKPIMSGDAFAKEHQELIDFVDRHLKEGVDYGRISGGKKKPLWKPGAEKLTRLCGLIVDFVELAVEADHDRVVEYDFEEWVERPKPDESVIETMLDDGTGRFRNVGERGAPTWSWQERVTETGTVRGLYRLKLKAVLKLSDGTVVGEGIGSCSTLESEYIRSPRENENKISKMAYKRSHVDVVLRTLGISDRFTQDEELIERMPAANDAAEVAVVADAVKIVDAAPIATAAGIDFTKMRQQQRAAAATADPKDRESRLTLIADISKLFDAAGIDDTAAQTAEAEKILGRRWRSLEDLRTLKQKLEERRGPVPPSTNEAWACAFADEIDSCTDGDELDRLIKNAHDKLQQLRNVDALTAHALEVYSIRKGALFNGHQLHVNQDEADALTWLETKRKERGHA